VAIVLGTVGALEVWSALGETQTWDEGIHLVAGFTYLTQGDYSWNQEHPPLAKIMSALPLTRMHLEAHRTAPDGKLRDEVQYGIDFLYRNRASGDAILIAGRGATMLLSVLFLAAVAWWTRRRFGFAAGLLAVTLCAFDPNLIAHSRYVTTDFPVTVFYFFACVLWVEYLETGRFRDLLAASAAFALAMATKFSAVILIPTLIALYGWRWAQRPKEFPWRRPLVASATLLAVLAVLVSVLYWPETVRCFTTDVPRLDTVSDRGNLVGKILFRLGRWFHLPAHRYLWGLGAVATHNSGGHPSYLMGLRSETGFWYYFPVVFAVKSTLAALLATAVGLAGGAWLAWKSASRGALARFRDIPPMCAGLLFPPLFYFGVSMTSGINLGMRHILPVYPFLYVGAAAMMARFASDGRAARLATMAMAALGLLQAAECARIAPDYLAYFNPLAGGPGNGPHYLVDSNIDWGQDVKKLVKWLDAHGTRRARVYYFGNAELRYYGVDELGFPGPLDWKGWADIDEFAVANVTPLQGVYVPLEDLAPLRLRQPIAKIGWSMYVYDLRKGKR